MSQIQRLLRFWYCLESLIPVDLDMYLRDPLLREKFFTDASSSDENLPWSEPSLTTSSSSLAAYDSAGEPLRYEHQVFLGIFDTAEAAACLKTLLNCGVDLSSELSSANPYKACYQSFKVSHAGFLIRNSLTVSIAPWTLNQIIQDRAALETKQWAQGFKEYSAMCITEFNAVADRLREQQPVTVALLLELQQGFEEVWKPDAFGGSAWIVSRLEPKRRSNHTDTQSDAESEELEPIDILNSFYLEDLEKVADALTRQDVGEALLSYLNPLQPEQRIDLSDPAALKQALSPGLIPLGRWAASPDRSLALMQQCAVNLAMSEKTIGKIFSVNGPPGTGKTTMLREIVADLLVQRSEQLVMHNDPEDAFAEIGQVNLSQDCRRTVFQPSSHLTGFEMVVASSNNGAIENITKELPSLNSIAEEYQEQIRYFQDVAINVTRDDHVWGIIAAVLGSKNNRYRFKEAFIFDRPDRRYPRQIGLPHQLGQLSCDRDQQRQQWQQAVQSFEQAKQKVLELQQRKVQCEDSLQALSLAIEAQSEVDRQIEQEQDSLDLRRTRYQEAQRQLHSLKSLITEEQSRLDMLAQRRFPWWIRLLSMLWKHPRVQAHKQKVFATKQELQILQQEISQLKHRLQERSDAILLQQTRLQSIEQQRIQCQSTVEQHQSALGEFGKPMNGTLPDAAWWARDQSEIQKVAPWLDREFNDARSQLFMAAIEVHARFVEAAKNRIVQNLYAWAKLISGESIPKEYVSALWQTFFLVVPVVSTTFASLGRMFQDLGRESIGYLLIDEAGQALPQAAVGAIWRSRRAIVVGDPLQIEPVFKIDRVTVDSLLRFFKIDSEWSPAHTSVQKLADRVNSYGTLLQTQQDRPLWVGCPLWVHRRCNEPMFSIANQLAYDNKMVFATALNGNAPSDSRWIHVEGKCEIGHWVPAQGEAVLTLLAQLMDQQSDLPDLYVISPFRDVAILLRERVQQSRQWAKGASQAKLEAWSKRSIGTVHTFQGKEADSVILVLGVDWQDQEAAHWAAATPNILNVAVTRARHRIYVIGDRNLWGALPHFSIAQKLLGSDGDRSTRLVDRPIALVKTSR